MKDNRKHTFKKQAVRQGMHPGDDGAGLAGIAKHRSTLSGNKSAVGSSGPANAAKMTGAISLGETTAAHRKAVFGKKRGR